MKTPVNSWNGLKVIRLEFGYIGQIITVCNVEWELIKMLDICDGVALWQVEKVGRAS